MKSLVFVLCCVFYASPALAAERILALAPHVCEILYAIGAEQDVVGVVSYCDYPEAAKALPHVGAYNRINVEAAARLKPTLAFVLSEATPGVKQLQDLGVKIVPSSPTTVDAVFENILQIGVLTGREPQAEALVNRLQKRLQHLADQVSGQPRRTFYEIWANPLLTAGNNTFIHDVLKRLNLENVFGSLALEAPRVNIESVIAAHPQLIIVPSEKRDIQQRTRYWKKWLGEDIQVITVNPDLLHRPGPRLLDGMADLVEQLQGLKH